MKLKIVLGFLGALALLFVLGLYGLGWMKFFRPKTEAIRREVFEETKSYVHGKVQDLAKYYEEYQKAESFEDKETIENLIKIRFAEFDADKIQSLQLRKFLINIRGY